MTFFLLALHSFVGYACAGKMDDIIGLTDGIRVNETGVGVPAETLEALERPFEGTVDPEAVAPCEDWLES